MNYCIQIETDLRGSTLIPLIEVVYRLGRDEKCEIQIPSKAAHALTVFRRTGTIFVLNRTKLQIHLGKTPLAGGATAKWCPGANIVIDGICLKLQCSSGRASGADAGTTVSGSPSASSVSKYVTTVRKAVPSPTEGKAKSQRSHIIVIATCLMMIGLMLCLGKPLESRNEEHFEQLARLSMSLCNIASEKNADFQSRARALTLLNLVAQYRVSVVVEKEPYAVVAKIEAEKFCDSIVRSSRVPDDEHSIVQQLGAVLGQIQ